jgi:hypothetical protein
VEPKEEEEEEEEEEEGSKVVPCVQLPLDKVKWRAFINTVMNLHVTLEIQEALDQQSDCNFHRKDSTSWR